ncbi:MAG: hypothetical protein GY757_28380, partial [bacterium]|nr:hypothetical protein [bacterium]
MATSNIMCIFQCSKGYLWFGTKNGLSRFDGIDFKNFKKKDGLLENCIIDITEDREGNLWLVTCRGSLCRLSAAGEFFNYSTRSGLGDKYVTVIAEDREGILRIGTKAGLLRFDGSDIKSHVNVDGFYSAGIKDIVFDGAGNMWVASKEDLFCLPKERAGGGEANHWKLGKRVISLFSDSCERLWIATMEGLVCFFNGEFTTYSSKDGLGHDVVSCLAEAGDGSIWIGTWGGVSRFSNGVWSNFTTETGLAANFINSIFYDREGNLWIATGGGGVSCLNSLKICSLSKKDGIVSKVVIDIVQDK